MLNMRAIMKFLFKSPWDDRDDNFFSKKKIIFPDNFNFNFSNFFNFNKFKIFLVLLVLVILWLASGIYSVGEGSRSVVTRFGKFVRLAHPGLNYHLPFPIEKKFITKVDHSRRIEIGYRSYGNLDVRRAVNYGGSSGASKDVLNESIMLTGDENIVELNADVMWHIHDLPSFLFNVLNPEITLKSVSESALRDVIGNSNISAILSDQKQIITNKVEALIQETLDLYKMGVTVEQVQLLKAEPPKEVIKSYRDVQTSKADKERDINYAHAYSNDILPKARGDAERIKQESLAYEAEMLAKANGDVERFNALLYSYTENRQVTKKRLYFDSLSDVFSKGNMFILESNQILPHIDVLRNNQFLNKQHPENK
ncbi:MAG: FtsH protease activity modulator HflK [Rickettsia sp.]|nr:FtsH protease activity modulator HflK [Rickettsia sp.]